MSDAPKICMDTQPNRGRAGLGRPKGSTNKSTKAVKEALQEAFEGLGGVPSLITWAQSEPTEFYKLWTKLLPSEVKAEVTQVGDSPVGKIQIEVISSAHSANQGD